MTTIVQSELLSAVIADPFRRRRANFEIGKVATASSVSVQVRTDSEGFCPLLK